MSIEADSVVKRYKVFVDTCSLMHNCAEDFFRGPMSTSLQSHDDKLVVLKQVIEELQKHARSDSKRQKKMAEIGLNRILREYKDKGILDVRGDPNEPFADANFLAVFTRFRTQLSLALITQDVNLAQDVLDLNEQRSVDSRYEITVFRLNNHGELEPWRFQRKLNSYGLEGMDEKAATRQKIYGRPKIKLPELPTEPTSLPEKPVRRMGEVKSGEKVLTENNGEIELGAKLGGGAQGAVYEISDSLVCKIYQPRYLTKRRLHKLKLMTEYDIDIEGVCWPRDLVYNQYNQLMGYVMKRAEGKDLRHVILGRKVLETYPDWKRINLVELSIEILEKVQKLHRRGILIGDINLDNIVVKSSDEVYLVDLDSCQIRDFPSAVAQPPFVSPQIYKKLEGRNIRKFGEFLRTYEDEYFALATLVFTILHPGQAPYAYQGGGSLVDNVKNERFPYPLGDESTGDAPLGPWRFIWSNLPYRIKEMFYKVFAEGERFPAQVMISELRRYKEHLAQGHHSNEIFPKTYKIIDPVEVKCFLCGAIREQNRQFIESLKQKNRPFVCIDCRRKGRAPVTVECSECGKEIEEKSLIVEILEKQGRRYVCDECRAGWEKIQVNCSVCGTECETYKGLMEKLESEGKSFLCDDCMDELEKVPVECSECGKSTEATKLRLHQLEEAGKEYVCDECRAKWEHVPVTCSECGKECEAMLKLLEKLENEGKSFVCDECREKIALICSECGNVKKEITKQFLEKLKAQGKDFVCEDCREKWQKIALRCAECGRTKTEITLGFWIELRSQGKDFVCRSCRAKWNS